MINVVHENNKIERTYECTSKRLIELCLANIESLQTIALIDSDEHIKKLGGERELLNLMNGYLDLAFKLTAIKGDFT